MEPSGYPSDMEGNTITRSIMLDEGSDLTLIREGLAEKLQLGGTKEALRLSGVTGRNSTVQSRMVRIRLNIEGREVVIKAASVPNICGPLPEINWPEEKKQWDHLQDLPLTETGGRVDILLGVDHADLMLATEYRMGVQNEPCAIKTNLGWVVRGIASQGNLREGKAHLLQHEPKEEDLNKALKKFFATETFGTERKEETLAPEDQRALDIVKAGTRRLDTGYEIALPWKEGEPKLEPNKRMAEMRLRSLEKRLHQDPDFQRDYEKAVRKYVSEGYASEINDDTSMEGVGFYLPHHGCTKNRRGRRKSEWYSTPLPYTEESVSMKR